MSLLIKTADSQNFWASESIPRYIYPREVSTYVKQKTCMQMFIVALFKIIKNWKQVSCRSRAEWEVVAYSFSGNTTAMKYKLLLHTTWINLTNIMLSRHNDTFYASVYMKFKITSRNGFRSQESSYLWREGGSVTCQGIRVYGTLIDLLLWVMIKWNVLSLWKFFEFILNDSCTCLYIFYLNKQFY